MTPQRLALPRGLFVVLLLLHVLPFAVRPALIGGDEPHYALMAHSLAVDGDFDLRDDYDEVAAGARWAGKKRAGQELDRHLLEVEDRVVFSHPVGLPLLAAPLLWGQQLLSPGAAPDILLGMLTLTLTWVALVVAYRTLWRWTDDARLAAIAVFGGYFSSPLWFYSRTFFTEPYTWAFAALAVAATVARSYWLAAVLLAVTLAMKETGLLLVVAVIGVTVWRRGPRAAARLALGPLAFAVFFGLKNLLLVGEPFATFQPYRLGSLAAGVQGLLVDAERGALWFAPLLVVGALVAVVASRRGRSPESLWAGGAFLAYFLVSAWWVDWRGGSGFGPRLIVPGLAALTVPLTGFSEQALKRGGFFAVALKLLFIAGFAVQFCAAVEPVPAFWSISVTDLLSEQPWRPLLGGLVGWGLVQALWHQVDSRPPA
ncbi:MAG: hypothetical protein AAF604_05260 [Acidobacteriota bacterium]